MPYIGNNHIAGDHTNNFKVLDDISTFTATFDGSASSVVDTTNNTIRVVEHRFIQGQRVTYTNGSGGNIGGLTTGTAYFVIFDSASTIKLATNASNAASNTAINLSAVGTGSSHTLNAAFDGVNTKFKLTHGSGTGARLNNATQINVAINNVVQRPNLDPNNFTDGFALEDNHKIVFQTAPTSEDIFWGSIIANTLTTFDISDHKIDTFTGDGSTTEFNLSHTPANNESLMVTINGVLQHPSNASTARAYTLIANVIQFTAAPGVGDEIQVRHLGFAGATTADVSGFYGRTGNVVLTDQDDITVNKINVGTGVTIESNGQATFVGVVTFGSGSTTIDNNVVNVGTALTLGHTQGLQFHTQNLHSAGFEINQINASGIITASSLDISGNAFIGGVLTYEDVTSIDSVGIITARDGIDCNGDIDVDGHTNLDNVSITGVTTIANNKELVIGEQADSQYNTVIKQIPSGSTGSLSLTTRFPRIYAHDTRIIDKDNSNTHAYFWPNQIGLYANGSEKLQIVGGGVNILNGNLSVSKDIDVDGHTNLDNVSVAGISTFSKNIILPDSSDTTDGRVKFGASTDMQIFHYSGANYIDVTSTLNIRGPSGGASINIKPKSAEEGIKIIPDGAVELYFNNGKRFETTGGGAQVSGTFAELIFNASNGAGNQYKFRASGTNSKGFELLDVTLNQRAYLYHNSTYLGGVHHFHTDGTLQLAIEQGHIRVKNDNSRLQIGASQDLQLFHDASDSYIQNQTGVFFIQNTGDLRIRVDNTDAAIHCVRNGAVELYHNNAKKLETQTNGVTVTGNVVSNHSNGQIVLQASDGSIEITKTAGGAYIDFKNSTSEDYDARINEEGGHLRVNTHFRLYDDKALELGNLTSSTYGDLRIFHDSSAVNNVIEGHTGSLNLRNYNTNSTDIVLSARNNILLQTNLNETAIQCLANGSVELFHDSGTYGTAKLQTKTSGIKVNGKLGINESSPYAELDIASSVEDTNGSLGNHGIRLHNASATDEDVIPITGGFKSQQDRVRAGIGFICKAVSGDDGSGGAIGFYTRNTADGNALMKTDERMRVHENGRVTIGDSDATPAGTYGLFHLYQASNDPYMIIQNGGAGDAGLDLGGIVFRNNTNAQGQIKSYQANINTANLHFYTNYNGSFADRFLMESTGTFSIQGNITDEKIVLANTSNPYIRFREGSTNKAYVQWNSGGHLGLYNQEDGSVLRVKDTLDFSKDGSTFYNVAHTGNYITGGENYTSYFVGTNTSTQSIIDTEKTRFYKVTIDNISHYGGVNYVDIMRGGVHDNNGIHGMWVGSMDVRIKFRTSNCGNGSNYSRIVHNYHSNTSSVTQGQGGGNIARIENYIACTESSRLYVWLRGQLTYYIRINGRPATIYAIDMNDYRTTMHSSVAPAGFDGESRDAYSIMFGHQGESGAGRKLYGTSGGVEAQGNVSATGSKPFKIPHPLVGLSTTKNLVHAAIEGPQCDNIYRGKTTLVAGISTVNIDTNAGMTDGTFATLNRDVQCFTTNETGWTPIKGSVSGNQLTILAQDNSCTDTISWMVVGERQDDNIINNTMTDSQGHLIVEPDFEEIVEPDNPGEFSAGSSQIGEDGSDQTFAKPLSS